MQEAQIKAICDPTRLRILGFLAENSLTNTELYNKFKSMGIVYRESIFKSLLKLKKAGLIEREYTEKIGYKYQLNFKELRISNNLVIKTIGQN